MMSFPASCRCKGFADSLQVLDLFSRDESVALSHSQPSHFRLKPQPEPPPPWLGIEAGLVTAGPIPRQGDNNPKLGQAASSESTCTALRTDTSVVSGRKFYRNIQSTPWSSKSGLAGKDVGHLRVVDLTEKGLDDYALRNLSNGEFQSVVFVRSVSEAVFTTNLLRLIRQDRLDIDGMAAHMHGAAPPDKHRESARFMEPLLGEVLRTLKSVVPVAKPTEHVNEELERAKRKLQQAG